MASRQLCLDVKHTSSHDQYAACGTCCRLLLPVKLCQLSRMPAILPSQGLVVLALQQKVPEKAHAQQALSAPGFGLLY